MISDIAVLSFVNTPWILEEDLENAPFIGVHTRLRINWRGTLRSLRGILVSGYWPGPQYVNPFSSPEPKSQGELIVAWHSGPVFSCYSITRYITNVNSPDVLLLAH